MKPIITFLSILFYVQSLYAQLDMKNLKHEQAIPLDRKTIFGNKNASSNNSMPTISYKKQRGETKFSNAGSGVYEGEGHIAMNPINNQNLVTSFMSVGANNANLPIYYTNDAGDTWLKSNFNIQDVFNMDVPGGDLAGVGDPVFAFDKNGLVYFTWIHFGYNSLHDTLWGQLNSAYSIDGGATWQLSPNHVLGRSAQNPITSLAYPGYPVFHDRQWMATDLTSGVNANQMYCSFLFIENSSTTGMYVKKKDPGNFSFNSSKTPVAIGIHQFGNIAVDNNGVLHYIYVDYDSNRIYHHSSSDGGATFSSPHLIYSGTNIFGHYINHIYSRENGDPNLAIDIKNNLYLVWGDFPTSASNNYFAYLSKSTDGGVTWSPKVELSTIFTNNPKVLLPQVCTHGDKVSIGAYSITNTKVADYYLATSPDNGVTFPASMLKKLSTAPTDFGAPINRDSINWFGDYFNAVRNECFVYNIWSDGRGTNGQKMYVAKTQECFPTAITEINTLNAGFSIDAIYPQPAAEVLHLKISNQQANKMNVIIINTLGEQLFMKQYQMPKTLNEIMIDTHFLKPGAYLLACFADDGTKISKMIVIK